MKHMAVKTIRKRYIAFTIVPKRVPFHELKDELLREAQQRKLTIWVLAECYNGTIGVIKTKHTDAIKVREMLSEITMINGKEVAINSMGTSGTIKTIKEKYLRNIKTNQLG